MTTPQHITPYALTPPFGHHALTPKRERLRQKAQKFNGHKLGCWGISFYRKRALKGLTPPFDVAIEPSLNARLYPQGNRCEKRAIAGIQIWDAEERAFLKDAIISAKAPFTFLDIGANIGLYSLYAAFYAAKAGKDINIHAVEPDRENARRLCDNIAANGYHITLWPAAVSDQSGLMHLTPHDDNRGEIKLSNTEGMAKDSEAVSVTTLADIIAQSTLMQIDLLKLDIEGHDLRALTQLFENCNDALYPKKLILETGTPDDLALMTLCYNRGYVVKGRGRLNIMLERDI